MKRLILVTVSMLSLQGCADTSMAMIRPQDFVGRSIDQIKNEMKSNGFSCGEEYSQKTVGPKQVLDGVVTCLGHSSGVCPSTQRVTLFFDLKTRMVNALGKSSRDSCF